MRLGRWGASAPDVADRLDHPRAGLGEDAVDHLSHEVIRRLVSRGRRGLTVAGVTDGVGVTTTATELVRALSRLDVSTLLIDADLQRPAAGARLQAEWAGPGLAEVLRGEVDFNEALDLTGERNLAVLHAGHAGSDGEARIFSRAFDEMLELSLRRFQITVVDAPPANRSTTAFHVARATGYCLLVARRHISFAQDLSLFADQMRQVGAEVLGSVLTG
ncbi:AAA family ATPase [Phenylobacterium sp.]|uniref:AAA family ATPase n=1 Tax=Phenylobacterium sp. TaxID=1871053 RepID=UPI0025E43309|nr:AAA family ATPase [Phenylobacterium sp.]